MNSSVALCAVSGLQVEHPLDELREAVFRDTPRCRSRVLCTIDRPAACLAGSVVLFSLVDRRHETDFDEQGEELLGQTREIVEYLAVRYTSARSLRRPATFLLSEAMALRSGSSMNEVVGYAFGVGRRPEESSERIRDLLRASSDYAPVPVRVHIPWASGLRTVTSQRSFAVSSLSSVLMANITWPCLSE